MCVCGLRVEHPPHVALLGSRESVCAGERGGENEGGAQNRQTNNNVGPTTPPPPHPHSLTSLSHTNQIYDAETTYFIAEYSAPGNVIKGLDGFTSTKDALRRRERGEAREGLARGGGGGDRGDRGGRGGFRVEDRLFSLSSTASPATAEAEAAALDALDGGGLAPSRSGKHLASKGLASKGRRSSGWG